MTAAGLLSLYLVPILVRVADPIAHLEIGPPISAAYGCVNPPVTATSVIKALQRLGYYLAKLRAVGPPPEIPRTTTPLTPSLSSKAAMRSAASSDVGPLESGVLP